MDTYRYADLINAAGDGTTDTLIADLREELEQHHSVQLTPADIDTVADTLRELLNIERV